MAVAAATFSADQSPQEATARRWLGDDLRDPVEALSYRCRFCQVGPGQACTTRDGKPLPYPHYSRDGAEVA